MLGSRIKRGRYTVYYQHHTNTGHGGKLLSLCVQMEAHSIFSRAAIQRLSITQYPPLSRGGSSSLLNLLSAEADERSVRRGQLSSAIERNYQSAFPAHGQGVFGVNLGRTNGTRHRATVPSHISTQLAPAGGRNYQNAHSAPAL